MNKADALQKIEELQAYIEGLDTKQNWEPGINEGYWRINTHGYASQEVNADYPVDKWSIQSGNCFRTQKDAENYKMRLIAMKPKYLPKMDEEYWRIATDCVDTSYWENDFIDQSRYYSGRTFKTQQEAQEWLDTYGKYFEVEANA